MSGAELTLGIIGVVDVCFRYGKALVKSCQAAKNADTRLSEASLRVEACWIRICTQLYVLRSIETSLDDQHGDINLRVLDVLQSKLRAADSRLTRVTKPQIKDAKQAKKAKFALFQEGLAEAINELEDWQGIFDPTWFLIMKLATPDVDKQLEVATREAPYAASQGHSSVIPAAQYMRRALRPPESKPQDTVFLPSDGLVPTTSETIKFSPVTIAMRVGNQQPVLLDPITCTGRSITNAVLKDSRRLAAKLRHADPLAFGLLECKGLLKRDSISGSQHSFVFRLPTTCQTPVQSLRGRLLEGPEYDSLTRRLDLAKQLVRAVSYIHVYDFVHKNIKPENILLLNVGDETRGAGEAAVLVGFDAFRSADGNTNRVGDSSWEKNLYRHPSRQGPAPQIDYDMRHDIYSVGVCLLEIGLWESFVAYEDGPGLIPVLGLGLVEQKGGLDLIKNTISVKDHLVELARGKLKRKVGNRYSQVVETCLTCLDDDNQDFGNAKDFEDQDGIAVGARYIERVIAKLADIVI